MSEAPATSLAWAVAASVVDPELPMLTIADLGVLRDVEVGDGRCVVTVTPTYSGCPAMTEMRRELASRLTGAGFAEVRVLTSLRPAWTSDWITADGRRKLVEAGISPPDRTAGTSQGPVPLTLRPVRRDIACPRCGSRSATSTSEFASTACRALYRCESCSEPFEHVKEI